MPLKWRLEGGQSSLEDLLSLGAGVSKHYPHVEVVSGLELRVGSGSKLIRYSIETALETTKQTNTLPSISATNIPA